MHAALIIFYLYSRFLFNQTENNKINSFFPLKCKAVVDYLGSLVVGKFSLKHFVNGDGFPLYAGNFYVLYNFANYRIISKVKRVTSFLDT